MMKIGVLYPRSKAHPGMMVDFMDGLKTGLKHPQLQNDLQLISESIGFGGNEKEVYEKAEKLLLLEAADILVAYIDLRVVSLLEPLMHATGKLLIVVNPGANYPENWVPQPNIIFLSLQHSFLCWLTGLLPSTHQFTSAAMATSFFDAGFLHTAAITKSYMNSGGSILYNYVNNNNYDESFEVTPLTNFLSSKQEIDCLLCVFDSKPGSLFYDGLHKYEESDRMHLFVSPMMLEGITEEKSEYNFSLEGYMPYNPAANSKTNFDFQELFKVHTNREASLFAMQGWELALVINEVFKNCKDYFSKGELVREYLSSIIIEGPRGGLKLDKETNYFIAPVYRVIKKNNANGMDIICEENKEEEWKNFIANPVQGLSSGWTNTYLCY